MANAIMRRRSGDAHAGESWVLTETGTGKTFTVPYSGKYQVEMHGGGGGANHDGPNGEYGYIGTGGGSGEVYEITLKEGDVVSYTIGKGGGRVYESAAGTGGTTTFGDLSIAGGGGGTLDKWDAAVGGVASGSLATSGSKVYSTTRKDGGYGNVNNPEQTYGNGGGSFNYSPQKGNDGGIILTYLGR